MKTETVVEYSGQYKTVNDYAEALRSWMIQVYQIQCLHSSFPFFLANLQAQSSLNEATVRSLGTTPNSPSSATSATATVNTATPRVAAQPPQRNIQNRFQNAAQQRQEAQMQGIEYTIPSFWKRFLAEMIDFLLLFVIKLGITYIAVDAFDLLEDIDKYDLETLRTDILNDYKAALSMTSDILLLELIHRIGTCVFEALCLHRGPAGLGGATPGKRLMKLRVVRCEFAAPALGDNVIVYPSTDLGIYRAIVRSVVKNFSMTFLFPVCFALFSFPHNRTIYDMLAGSIVVQERTRPNNNNR
ncbi:Protein FAM8A1 [Armadillidium nasatum]|uniref:Protein FAM8A1 n=1 Tax=Armadillidium nasatum TaxID=96803 RepID=A0A5N5SI30_9CRUS|nr:Protein FAM8A1 [Armadillidium nasatum]